MVRDTNTAFALAFGAFMAVMVGASGLAALADDGLTVAELLGGVLVALAVGVLTGVLSFHANRWLRRRGYGIGDDER